MNTVKAKDKTAIATETFCIYTASLNPTSSLSCPDLAARRDASAVMVLAETYYPRNQAPILGAFLMPKTDS